MGSILEMLTAFHGAILGRVLNCSSRNDFEHGL